MKQGKTLVHKDYLGKIETYPTGHMILIKPDLSDDVERANGTYKMKGGTIEIPEEVAKHFAREQKAQQRGTVIAVGMIAYSDWHEGELWCKPGDTIIFTRHAGMRMFDERLGEDVILMSDNDINGVKSHVPPGWTAEEYEKELANV